MAIVTRRGRYDVVYSFGVGPNLLAVLARMVSGCGVVWGIRNTLPTGPKFMRWIERTGARCAGAIVSNSVRGKSVYAEAGLPAEKICVIPNGIDTEIYDISNTFRSEVRSEWGIEDHEMLVGAVGRCDANKDRESLVRAIRVVVEWNPDIRFVIIGGGRPDSVKRVQELASELGVRDRIIWAPPRGDIHRCLNAFDVFVSSSITEGFPNVIAEAMAVGVPCVVTDAGDSAFIVGATGIVVPPSQPDRLAAAVIDSLSHLQEVDHMAIRSRIVEIASVESMVERTEEALAELL